MYETFHFFCSITVCIGGIHMSPVEIILEILPALVLHPHFYCQPLRYKQAVGRLYPVILFLLRDELPKVAQTGGSEAKHHNVALH